MSRFTSAQREEILDEARTNISRRSEPTLVYKTHVNDAARTVSDAREELPWWEWVERCVAARLTAAAEGMGQVLGDFHDEALREVAALKRELECLRQEVTVLREQVGLERGLRDLRNSVEEARAQVPQVPAIAARLAAQNARLRRDVAATKNKVSRLRVDQSVADYRLAELSKATAARAAVLETKMEFTMREVHAEARTALRDFATETLKGKTIWCFDPGMKDVTT